MSTSAGTLVAPDGLYIELDTQDSSQEPLPACFTIGEEDARASTLYLILQHVTCHWPLSSNAWNDGPLKLVLRSFFTSCFMSRDKVVSMIKSMDDCASSFGTQ